VRRGLVYTGRPRKTGALQLCGLCKLWVHGPLDTIAITANGPTTRYVRPDSDGDLAFVSCATWGVTTNWEPTTPQNGPAYLAVNAALCDPATTTDLRIRHFDGADAFAFLD
jgi:hypothetical protein